MLSSAEYMPSTHFIWADKVALTVGLLVSLFLLLFLLFDFIAAGSSGVSHLWKTLGVQGIELNLLLGGFLWICLRSIDYLSRVSYRLLKDSSKNSSRGRWRAVARSDASHV